MKKTVRAVEYLSLLFLVWTLIFMDSDAFWLAFIAGSATLVCFGVAVGSFAYCAFNEVRNRREGGE